VEDCSEVAFHQPSKDIVDFGKTVVLPAEDNSVDGAVLTGAGSRVCRVKESSGEGVAAGLEARLLGTVTLGGKLVLWGAAEVVCFGMWVRELDAGRTDGVAVSVASLLEATSGGKGSNIGGGMELGGRLEPGSDMGSLEVGGSVVPTGLEFEGSMELGSGGDVKLVALGAGSGLELEVGMEPDIKGGMKLGFGVGIELEVGCGMEVSGSEGGSGV
jgi:hypothetical protein